MMKSLPELSWIAIDRSGESWIFDPSMWNGTRHLFAHLDAVGQAEDLEAAAVGENGASPAGEGVEVAELRRRFLHPVGECGG